MQLELYITRPNCALDRRTIFCLYVPGFQRQVFKHVNLLREQSKESEEQKKNKGSVLVAESAHNAQKQFGVVMYAIQNTLKKRIKRTKAFATWKNVHLCFGYFFAFTHTNFIWTFISQ